MVGGGYVSGRENSMIVTPHTVTEAIGGASDHKMLGLDGLQDTRLSYKARGVLAVALSLVDDGRPATISSLQQESDRDGREAVASALRELTALGYRTVTPGSQVEWRRSL
jgi:hypothetical protein